MRIVLQNKQTVTKEFILFEFYKTDFFHTMPLTKLCWNLNYSPTLSLDKINCSKKLFHSQLKINRKLFSKSNLDKNIRLFRKSLSINQKLKSTQTFYYLTRLEEGNTFLTRVNKWIQICNKKEEKYNFFLYKTVLKELYKNVSEKAYINLINKIEALEKNLNNFNFFEHKLTSNLKTKHLKYSLDKQTQQRKYNNNQHQDAETNCKQKFGNFEIYQNKIIIFLKRLSNSNWLIIESYFYNSQKFLFFNDTYYFDTYSYLLETPIFSSYSVCFYNFLLSMLKKKPVNLFNFVSTPFHETKEKTLNFTYAAFPVCFLTSKIYKPRKNAFCVPQQQIGFFKYKQILKKCLVLYCLDILYEQQTPLTNCLFKDYHSVYDCLEVFKEKFKTNSYFVLKMADMTVCPNTLGEKKILPNWFTTYFSFCFYAFLQKFDLSIDALKNKDLSYFSALPVFCRAKNFVPTASAAASAPSLLQSRSDQQQGSKSNQLQSQTESSLRPLVPSFDSVQKRPKQIKQKLHGKPQKHEKLKSKNHTSHFLKILFATCFFSKLEKIHSFSYYRENSQSLNLLTLSYKYQNDLILYHDSLFFLTSKRKALINFFYSLRKQTSEFYLQTKKYKIVHSYFSLFNQKTGLEFKGFYLIQKVFLNVKTKKQIFFHIDFNKIVLPLWINKYSPLKVNMSDFFFMKKQIQIVPSPRYLLTYLIQLKKIVSKSKADSQKILIQKLKIKINQWCDYYKIVSNKKSLNTCDQMLFKWLWRWACRRHSNKSHFWIRNKYYHCLQKAGKFSKWRFCVFNKTLQVFECLPEHKQTRLVQHKQVKTYFSLYDENWKYWYFRN